MPTDTLEKVLRIAKNTLKPEEELHKDLKSKGKLWVSLNRLGIMPGQIARMKPEPAIQFIGLYKTWLDNFRAETEEFPALAITKARMLRNGFQPPFPPKLMQPQALQIIMKLEEPPDNPTIEDMQGVLTLFNK